jgi:hypothetical protein
MKVKHPPITGRVDGHVSKTSTPSYPSTMWPATGTEVELQDCLDLFPSTSELDPAGLFTEVVTGGAPILTSALTASAVTPVATEEVPIGLGYTPTPVIWANTPSTSALAQDTPTPVSWTSTPSTKSPSEITPPVPTPVEGPVPASVRSFPPPQSEGGQMVQQTRDCVAQLSNSQIDRLWEHPSRMIGGVIYRRVTETVTLADGTIYKSSVEELEKPERKRSSKSSKSKSSKSSKSSDNKK